MNVNVRNQVFDDFNLQRIARNFANAKLQYIQRAFRDAAKFKSVNPVMPEKGTVKDGDYLESSAVPKLFDDPEPKDELREKIEICNHNKVAWVLNDDNTLRMIPSEEKKNYERTGNDPF